MVSASLSTMEQEVSTNSALNPISVFIGGTACGIFLASFVSILPLVSLLIIILGLAILIDRKKEVVFLSIILISFGFGSLRYAVKDFHEPQTPSAQGVVVDEPMDTENTRRFVYEADNGEKVLVSAPLYTEVMYGDRVEVKGNFKEPGVIEGESGERDFDYGAYLSKDDIYFTMSFAEVTVLAHDQGSPLRAALLKVKSNFVSHIQSILPEPQSALLAGLIVAGKGSLPESVLEDFRRAGVVHIVVLSGFNVTLIAEFLRRILQAIFIFAGVAAAPLAIAGASAGGIILFVLMTGASATVVRAAAMALIVLFARHIGRSFSAPRALALAAFVMLMMNPKILVFDPSFQLSFLATLGLIYIVPVIERGLSRVALAKWGQMRETLAQTIGTQLAVLPLLVYSVGDISIVSLPANILTLLVVPFAMLGGFIATLLSYIHTVVAWPISFISHLLLSWVLAVANFFGSLPFATLRAPNMSVFVITALYVCLFVSIMYFKWRERGGLRHEFSTKSAGSRPAGEGVLSE